MRTSARNQFSGTIVDLKAGAVNDEITVRLAGSQDIVAIITHESTVSLKLAKGKQVFVLIKASSVILMTDLGGAKVSARNCIAGKVSNISRGAVNADITIAAANDCRISAVITNQSLDRLGLSEGKPATAIFKASSVLIGVED